MEGKFRVLIVDDDPNILSTMRAIARHHRMLETEVVDKPILAGGRIRQNPPYHIILTDLVMPGMTGVDLLKLAKAKSPDTKVILVAGFGDQQMLMDAIKFGVYDYIHKPFRPEELNLMLNNCTERCLHLRENAKLRLEVDHLKAGRQQATLEITNLRHENERLRQQLHQFQPQSDSEPTNINEAIAAAAAKKVSNIQPYDIYRELKEVSNLLENNHISQEEFTEIRKSILNRAYGSKEVSEVP
ncbi:response regulator [Acanthopleuribacter pedis]|uniref:Response regulator n=1 Tax=Acanthopleuribacter pedis TaxID=442870 RepID=A0A8J7U5K9_9BACT|nr:response regulator [Acanthopleuribacter pedis]MBO1320563.1 response regulator [Acanthopleuribacter pedis]